MDITLKRENIWVWPGQIGYIHTQVFSKNYKTTLFRRLPTDPNTANYHYRISPELTVFKTVYKGWKALTVSKFKIECRPNNTYLEKKIYGNRRSRNDKKDSVCRRATDAIRFHFGVSIRVRITVADRRARSVDDGFVDGATVTRAYFFVIFPVRPSF